MQPEVKVEQVQLDTLKPYSGNAKKHTNEQIDAVEQSIKQFGFRNPILAWHNEAGEAEIVAGHGRAIAAKKLGIKEVPVVFVDDLTDAQRRMLTHADNQTTMMTGWDYDQLTYELDVLGADFEVNDFGFDVGSIDWADGVEELSEETYEEPEKEQLVCPACGHVDTKAHFKAM